MDILIYAVIVGFLAWRLYAALGTRHGSERVRGVQSEPPKTIPTDAAPPGAQKNLLALPLGPAPAPLPKLAPAPESLAGALYVIQKADASFDEKSFLKGARLAFETIVHAFAAGEEETLRPLLSPVLFESFKSAIDARKSAGQSMSIGLLNVIEAHVLAAKVEGRYARITVEIVSDQTRNGTAPERMHDLWTFRREMGDVNPNWMLVETKTA